jgi:hypothetical protein
MCSDQIMLKLMVLAHYELHTLIKQPTVRNMHKALVMQFTLGTFPIILLMTVVYWAYKNTFYLY